jgi:hypothetical protein
MKTPINELIEWIDKMLDSPMSLTFSEIDFRTLYQFREKFVSLLETEKQQIIDAYDAGLMEQCNSIDYFFDKYENVSK